MHGSRRPRFALVLAAAIVVSAGVIGAARTATQGVSIVAPQPNELVGATAHPVEAPAPDPVWSSGQSADGDRGASKLPTPLPLGALVAVALVGLGAGALLAVRRSSGHAAGLLLVPCGLRAPPAPTAV